MAYKTKTIKTINLELDSQNPRFVANNKKLLKQEEIIEYLLEYEEITELAKSINNYGGLLPGERILITTENSKYVVLEGNRRTTAMKLLLNPNLIPENYKNDFPIITDTCKNNIENIEVDIIDSRDDSLYVLTKRHVDGIKHWRPISKLYFYKKQFDEGRKVNELSNITGESESKIKECLQKFNFLSYMINCTNDERLSKRNIITQLETDLVTGRIYNRSKEHFYIPYNQVTFELDFSNIPQEKIQIFNDILKAFAQIIWFEDDENIRLTSRKINKVKDFNKLFIEGNEYSESVPIYKFIKEKINSFNKLNRKEKQVTDNMRNLPIQLSFELNTERNTNSDNQNSYINNNMDKIETGFKTKDSSDSEIDKSNKNSNEKTPNKNKPTEEIKKQPKPKERKYLFEGITYSGSDQNIQRILYEIQRLDINKFTLSATYLMRTLLECSLQSYLTNNNLFSNWKNKGSDPSISDLINYCKQHNSFKNINKNFQRTIETAHALKDCDQLNSITHAKYNLPNTDTLWNIEKRWYLFIKFLLT